MKWFDVRQTAAAHILVQADNEEEAYQFAIDELDCGHFQTIEGETSEVPEDEVETYRRHADLVVEGNQ